MPTLLAPDAHSASCGQQGRYEVGVVPQTGDLAADRRLHAQREGGHAVGRLPEPGRSIRGLDQVLEARKGSDDEHVALLRDSARQEVRQVDDQSLLPCPSSLAEDLAATRQVEGVSIACACLVGLAQRLGLQYVHLLLLIR